MTGRELRCRYNSARLPRHLWRDLPPERVDLTTLVPTQWPHYGVCQRCTLRLGRPVEGGDPLPYLVEVGGRRFIWDGHTRVAMWLRGGRRVGEARVLRVDRGA